MTDHDFARHYLATLLVVSSSHPNPMEQFQQLNDQLTQFMVFTIFHVYKYIVFIYTLYKVKQWDWRWT